MIRILSIHAAWTEIRREGAFAEEVLGACREIIAAVRARGDDAVFEYTQRFDGVDLRGLGLQVPEHEFAAAEAALSTEVRGALRHAVSNIRAFHETQLPRTTAMIEVEPGVWCGDRITPIDSVCLYVPRGRGSFSSVMCMLGVPAVVARVPRIAVCTPPGRDGRVDAATLVAARLLGIGDVYRIGGAQAVAAIAYGTNSIQRCSKLVGPGNVHVSAARRLLSGILDPGPPAGPSESIVLCDERVDVENAAWNLLIEAEHGENSCAVLLVHHMDVARRIASAAERFLAQLSPKRQEYAGSVLSQNGGIVVTGSLEASIEFINNFAPEHLAVMVSDAERVLPSIRNAGEILIGDYPIISLGNYAMGLNAILPTGRQAITRSCVSVYDFLKRSSVGRVDRTGFESLRSVVSTLSRDEGFSAHHLAVENWKAPR